MSDNPSPAVFVRRARHEDVQCMRDFVQQLSSTSRRNRFHGVVSGDSPQLLNTLLDDDRERHGAWVACVWGPNGEQIIGEGGWHIVDAAQGRAELGLSVLDSWQGSGVAHALMTKLIDGAREAGVQSLYGEVLESNERMLAFMQRYGMQQSADDWPWDRGGAIRMERKLA
ncbi:MULTISPECIES: GNAT family N-acetyltransferase [Ramlibacter]|uniref:GNAT family N-acetyltransferase n=1 Tax=Ramlibacter pinisoli TaxID=2682844 RepID=A0A6N8ITT5_9BURK|nr:MULTISPECIES: GNAT family N-acetyltransferase [Ramlibacter]MBA2964357.1 GNAT family N-acetyltransferase [Ramlibacter sp. CGMCC 1.13660]MVQ29323.1 GNAT family N-acetyltransferase [Ramlibacter pinisoli]